MMQRAGRNKTPAERFFLNPPWRPAAGLGLFAGVCVFILFFIGGLLGEEGTAASRAGVLLSCAAGLAGIWPIVSAWGRSGWRIVSRVFAGAAVRMLIGLAGVIIIFAFTDIHRIWLLLFMGLAYPVFLGIDTAAAVWLLKHAAWEDNNAMVHDNIWDTVGD